MSVEVPVFYPDLSDRREISVCYSVLYGHIDDVDLMVQNIQYNLMMGAQHLFLYNMNVSRRVEQLFRWDMRGIFDIKIGSDWPQIGQICHA